jgi:hypothetical protein
VIICKKVLNVLPSASNRSSACEVCRGSRRDTVLELVGKYCFVIIQVAWDDVVISCWVWQLGNLKSLAWEVRIKRSYKKCNWERGGEKSV